MLERVMMTGFKDSIEDRSDWSGRVEEGGWRCCLDGRHEHGSQQLESVLAAKKPCSVRLRAKRRNVFPLSTLSRVLKAKIVCT
jgi:hypothetical protein